MSFILELRSASGFSARAAFAGIGARAGACVLASGTSNSGARESWSGEGRFSFAACDPVETSNAFVPETDQADEGKSEAGWGGFAAAPRWIGAIPYEAMRAVEITAGSDLRAIDTTSKKAKWNRYDAVARLDHRTGIVSIEADNREAAMRLADTMRASSNVAGARSSVATLTPIVADADARHMNRVAIALDSIERGDVYEVNVARTLHSNLEGSAWDLFVLMNTAAPSPFAAYLDLGEVRLLSASPELAVRVDGDLLVTHPLKGTRLRGTDAESDEAIARELDADEKENAELVMAVDVHRNDLSRVARVGSVRADPGPVIHRGANVHSRGWTVRAVRRRDVTLTDIARAVLPCGSVTGAPKRRAMELICELEDARRGFYTGAIGYIGRDRRMVLSVAIRTLRVDLEQHVTYGVGGGIVSASNPARECAETWWKTAHLTPFTRSAKRTEARRTWPLTGSKAIRGES